MWETTDPDGREVILTDERWEHILDRHEYIGVGPDTVLGTVAQPDRRTLGHEEGEEWFYRHDAGPSAWIRVVVHYEHGHGRIATAFPRRTYP